MFQLTPTGGRRPVLLVARNQAYEVLTWVMVAPITTRLRNIPTMVALNPHPDSLPRSCTVSLDNIQAIRKEWLANLILRLRKERMDEVDRVLRFALGMR